MGQNDKMSNTKIGDYAFLSDLHSSALVSDTGSIDWFSLPLFDSPAYFAKLLGTKKNGYWELSLENLLKSERKYIEGTKILVSTFSSKEGVVEVTDFMAHDNDSTILARKAVVTSGKVIIKETLGLRSEYGKTAAVEIEGVENGHIFRWEKETVSFLTTSKNYTLKDSFLLKTHDLSAGEEISSFIIQGESKERPDFQKLYENTRGYWLSWFKRINYDGPEKELVYRSALTLKALTYKPTGAILAAATTSLPEILGGERNWDYRYTWLRDSVFTVRAFSSVGQNKEARAFFNWALKTVSNDPDILSVGYTIEGKKACKEKVLSHLEGFKGSQPVRIGNSGLNQFQLDVFGEFITCLHHCWKNKMIDLEIDLKSFIERLLFRLLNVCEKPDQGIWEIRGESKFYTYSQAMAWIGLDKGYDIYSSLGGSGIPEDEIKSKKDKIYKDIFERGVDHNLNCFIQSFDSKHIDAANLRLSLVGFIDSKSEIMLNTVNQTMKRLCDDGGVRRYNNDDGLDGTEGYFLTCSFWLAENLAFQGRIKEAQELLQKTIIRCNDVGLLSEEVDSEGNLLGNFSQAFSHIGLINACLSIAGDSSLSIQGSPHEKYNVVP